MASCFLAIFLAITGILLHYRVVLPPVFLLLGTNLFLNRKLFRDFHATGGSFFAINAVLYYTLAYPFAVGLGVFSGLFSQHFRLRS